MRDRLHMAAPRLRPPSRVKLPKKATDPFYQSSEWRRLADAGPVAKNDLRRPFCDLFIENVKRLMGS